MHHELDRSAVLYHSLMPADPSRVSPFGRQVRRWRAIRRMSQLDLAVAAGTTPRHLSFVETGRSRPRRDLILRIADALTVPLPERNTLLAAAGLPPAFPAHDLAHLRDRPAMPETRAGSSPVVCPVFELGGQVIRTISTVMRFDAAIEVTTSQLRVELMFPADDAAEAYFRAHQPT